MIIGSGPVVRKMNMSEMLSQFPAENPMIVETKV
jgi:hypothetical protein